MSEVNVFTAELAVDEDDPEGFREVGYARLGPLLGASKLGMTVYELPPGTSNWRTRRTTPSRRPGGTRFRRRSTSWSSSRPNCEATTRFCGTPGTLNSNTNTCGSTGCTLTPAQGVAHYSGSYLPNNFAAADPGRDWSAPRSETRTYTC